jgi:hypothetical protein
LGRNRLKLLRASCSLGRSRRVEALALGDQLVSDGRSDEDSLLSSSRDSLFGAALAGSLDSDGTSSEA